MSGVAGTTGRTNLGTQGAGKGTQTLNLAAALRQARGLFEAGKIDEAAKLAVAILTQRPGQPGAVQIVAAVAEKKGKPERAIQILQTSLTGRKSDAMAQMNLCRLLRTAGRLDESVKAGEAAARFGALDVYTDIGDTLMMLGEVDRALEMFERAVALQPELPRAHLSMAHALLMKGDYHAGWVEYEWRYQLKSTRDLLPKFKQPMWNGMELKASTLLVICEQGYGDCFQYARYLKLAKGRVKNLIVGASTELKPLIERIVGPGRVYDRWMREHLARADVRLRVDIFNAKAAMLRTGIGVGVLPTFMQDKHPELVAVSEPIPELAAPVWILTHPDLRKTERVRAFMQFVGDAIRKRLAGQP